MLAAMPVSTAKSSIWVVDVAAPGKCVVESPTPRMKTTGTLRLLPVYAQDAT
jgi:hypothetical protein